MSDSIPPVFGNAAAAPYAAPPPHDRNSAGKLRDDLYAAPSSEDVVETIITSGGGNRINDEKAYELAKDPDSNSGEFTAGKREAVMDLGERYDIQFSGVDGPSTVADYPSIPTLAAHLSEEELASARGASLLIFAQRLMDLIQEDPDSQAAASAKLSLNELLTDLSGGQALTADFVYGFIDSSRLILSVLDTQFLDSIYNPFIDEVDVAAQIRIAESQMSKSLDEEESETD